MIACFVWRKSKTEFACFIHCFKEQILKCIGLTYHTHWKWTEGLFAIEGIVWIFLVMQYLYPSSWILLLLSDRRSQLGWTIRSMSMWPSLLQEKHCFISSSTFFFNKKNNYDNINEKYKEKCAYFPQSFIEVPGSRNVNALAWHTARSFFTVLPSERVSSDNKRLHPFASSVTLAFLFFHLSLGDQFLRSAGSVYLSAEHNVKSLKYF